jgi:penicillin amidase
MQGDDYDLFAEDLVPLILNLQFSDPDLRASQQLLGSWDYRADIDSAPAALFYAFWLNLSTNTFQDELPDYYQVGVGSKGREIIRRLIDYPSNSWWDDSNTKDIENRDDILKLSFESGYKQLTKELGKDMSEWSWGTLHTVTFENQVMSSFPFINKVFNRGPFETAGGSEIINATGWGSYDPFTVGGLPSMRMVVDLNDLSKSITIHPTGQSGHAFHPHYIDMADLWRKIYYHPMLWTPQQIKSQSESLLILNP